MRTSVLGGQAFGSSVAKRRTNGRWLALWGLLLLGLAPPSTAGVVNCDAARSGTGSVLYLYYPLVDDPDFVSPISTVTTSPVADFDVAEIDASLSETALIDRITEFVRKDYCEFDVETIETRSGVGTTDPLPTDTRWQVVAIGTDSQTYGTGTLFGIAQDVDLGDSDPQDNSRVWAGSFLSAYGGAGGALSGANSTLDRWANAIAGTTSHEAGHNYGLGHGDSSAVPGEADTNNHIMATGSTGLTGEQRAQSRRFGNTSFEILAANLGLYEKTLSNWDLINPNAVSADGLELTILVPPAEGPPTATSVYSYTGSSTLPGSPWTDVTIAADGTETFQGTSYNRFVISFVSDQAWLNENGAQPSGEVPPGEMIHLGVGVDVNNVVRDTEFLSGGVPLGLKPRIPGFDATSTFMADGTLNISIFNFEPNDPLELSTATVMRLPRTLILDEMVGDGSLVAADGVEIQPWSVSQVQSVPRVIDARAELPVGQLKEGRVVEMFVPEDPNCVPGVGSPGDSESLSSEVQYCPSGSQVSLFPSARVYIQMTSTDPDALYYDVNAQKMVNGPLETKLFVQVAGQMPDCNENGIDDLIEIRNGTLPDRDENGYADQCEAVPGVPGVSNRGLIVMALLLGFTAVAALGFRERTHPGGGASPA